MQSSLAVVTPAECFDLTVLATVKAELGIPESNTSQDAILATLIRQASSAVSAFCDTVFAEETVTETFWADSAWEYINAFPLSRSPVSSISSVVVDGSTLDSSQYRLGANGTLYKINGAITCRWFMMQLASITYTAGYALLDGLPQGIERATLMLIKEYRSGIGRDPRIRSEEIPGVRSVTYWVGSTGEAGELPPDVIALLQPYRRMALA